MELYSYQLKALEWLEQKKSGLLFMDAGTGKSFVVLTYCKRSNFKSILIFCPKTAKKNWVNEIKKSGCDENYFTIETYTSLLTKQASRLLKEWDCIIADECQRVSHWSSKTTKRFHKLSARNRVALSGTPWKNKIWEAHSVLHWIQPQCLGKNWWDFRTRFLIFSPYIQGQIIGVRDEQVIKKVIDCLSYRVFRDQEDVQDSIHLPKLITTEKRFDLKNFELNNLYEIKNDALLTIQENKKLMMSNILVSLTRMRQCVDDPISIELDRVGTKEHVLCTILKDKKSTLIYSPFSSTMKRLACKYGGLLLTGENSEDERNNAIKIFQQGINDTLFITSAGGEAINLTKADRVIFYALPYTWADVDQVTSRAHRN